MEEKEYANEIERYIAMGAIEIAGVDENGEILFAINESAKETAPELWKSHMHFIDKTLVDLYESGDLTVEYDENLEATISLSEEGFRIAKEKGILPLEMPEIPNN